MSRAGRVALRPAAAVAEKMSGAAASQFQQPAGKGLGFYTGEDGFLYCDNMKVDDIRHQVGGLWGGGIWGGGVDDTVIANQGVQVCERTAGVDRAAGPFVL
jgi:hypothetical protein